MKTILFFDTETTGLVKNWDVPGDDKNPRLVQLGMMLCDEDGRPLFTYGSLVKPVNFSIPAEATAVHKISTEMALKYGNDIHDVMAEFNHAYQVADLVVAHNIKFDKVVVDHEMQRLVDCLPCVKELFCTMLASTQYVKAVQSNGRRKWPKLSEAYKFFFNEELKDAHDALTDVMACKRIYFEGLGHYKGDESDEPGKNLSTKPISQTFTPPSVILPSIDNCVKNEDYTVV